ncbi:MAG: glycosyltransferase [Pirellulales bacterium]
MLPGPSAVICMADSEAQLAEIKDTDNVHARLNLIVNDASDAFQLVRPPSGDDARRILDFVESSSALPFLVIQCEVGVGRSQAVAAALARISGLDNNAILRNGTYNRRLYHLLLAAANVAPQPEPLVSLNVRVKYAPDRLELFLLSIKRQRYDNWEVVAVTDGPNPAASRLVAQWNDPRVRLIETDKALGLWGHPYRPLGIAACRGEFIGLSNDDNYYVPGYLEQMLFALENADLAVCPMLHSYYGWKRTAAGGDIGCWIARASLVRQLPWPGNHFHADQDFYGALVALAGDRVVKLDRPLFVHN